RAAKTGRKRCRDRLQTQLAPGNFLGIAADVMIHRLGLRERPDRWQYAECVTGQKNNVRRVACNAWNLRVLDEFYRISAASVLRNADVCIIYQMVLIEHHVLEHRAKTERLEDLRFVLGRQIDGLGVATPFDVENALVTPAMLIVANETAFGVGRQRRLPCPRQAE